MISLPLPVMLASKISKTGAAPSVLVNGSMAVATRTGVWYGTSLRTKAPRVELVPPPPPPPPPHPDKFKAMAVMANHKTVFLDCIEKPRRVTMLLL
jgi:hypothetical protein